MSVVSKGILILRTVRYLKLRQLINQIAVRLKRKESFRKYYQFGIRYSLYNFWIDGLDNDSDYVDRFSINDLLDGKLTLLFETREFNMWRFPDASHLWNFNVQYLEYLIPLYSQWRATGDEKYQKKINEILESWYNKGSFEADSSQPYTISLRVINQLIVAGAVDCKQKLFDSIYAQYRYLLKHQEKHLLGNHYLENLKAIVICSVVFNEGKIYKKYVKRLLTELKEETTEDGLHFELSLMYHKIVLEDLIRVAVLLNQGEKKEYKDVLEYIKKMSTALSSLEHGINRTPLFNDAGDNVAKTKESLLNTCKHLFSIVPEKYDCISGYYKLYDGKLALIIDAGKLSPTYMPGHAHCDCLSFEMFYNGKPIFVNSGTYQYQGEKRKYFRSTIAHNTVTMNNHEQSELWGEHRAGRRLAKIEAKAEGKQFVGSYVNFCGEKHTRSIRMDNGILEVIEHTSESAESYLHLAPGLIYQNGSIDGSDCEILINPINCIVDTKTTPYADSFGKIEETECLIFSWENDNEEHGYKVIIKEKDI